MIYVYSAVQCNLCCIVILILSCSVAVRTVWLFIFQGWSHCMKWQFGNLWKIVNCDKIGWQVSCQLHIVIRSKNSTFLISQSHRHSQGRVDQNNSGCNVGAEWICYEGQPRCKSHIFVFCMSCSVTPKLRKRPKTVKNRSKFKFLPFFSSFWAFPQSR